MNFSVKMVTGLAISAILIAGCVKKVDPVDEYFVTVDYTSTGSKYDVTGDMELNPKDSVYLNFTLTSAREDISLIEIQKNGARIDTLKVSGSNVRQFSGSKKYLADSIPGPYTYRVVARNSKNVFIGDGDKDITITIKPDFHFWSYRFLYVPDTTAKTNKTYFATTTGQTLSYSEVGSNSGLIDFGFLYDTAVANRHTIYALNTNPMPNQVSFYDISTWTKNATIFKRVTTPTFANLTSGGALRTAGIANLASGTSSKITSLVAGNVILFRTAQGKYGAIQVSFIEGASPAASTYINMDVKVQK